MLVTFNKAAEWMKIIAVERTKRRSLQPNTECHAETKNESIYSGLFILYFWLATKKKRKRQFRGHSFPPFSSSALKTGLANGLAALRRRQRKRE